MATRGAERGRADGRSDGEIRPIRLHVGVLNNAHGSAYIEWGKNKIMVGVYGPRRPARQEGLRSDRALVRCTYNMAPFSVSDRKRPGRDRRSLEISKVLSEALTNAVLVERFPRTVIDVNVEVLEADAGTRCAALTAASVALADAGLQMRDLVSACAVGVVDGRIVLDPSKDEDNFGDGDMPIGILPSSGEIVLLQMDGALGPDQFGAALDMGVEACRRIHALQRDALLMRYGQDRASRIEKPPFSGYGDTDTIIMDDEADPPIWGEEVIR